MGITKGHEERQRRACGSPGRRDEALLFPVGGQKSPLMLTEVGAGTGGKEGAGWTSESPTLTGSLLRGLFGCPDRVGRQVRLSNNKEGRLP